MIRAAAAAEEEGGDDAIGEESAMVFRFRFGVRGLFNGVLSGCARGTVINGEEAVVLLDLESETICSGSGPWVVSEDTSVVGCLRRGDLNGLERAEEASLSRRRLGLSCILGCDQDLFKTVKLGQCGQN